MATDRGPKNRAGNCSLADGNWWRSKKPKKANSSCRERSLRGCEFGDLSWLVDQGPALES